MPLLRQSGLKKCSSYHFTRIFKTLNEKYSLFLIRVLFSRYTLSCTKKERGDKNSNKGKPHLLFKLSKTVFLKTNTNKNSC